jgi:hypothetical protein
MNKTKINSNWLVVAVFVLICASTWAATNAYHGYVNKKEVVAQKELLVPLDPKIDQEIFDTLESKTHLEEEKLIEILSGLGSEIPIAETATSKFQEPMNQVVPTPTPAKDVETIEIP